MPKDGYFFDSIIRQPPVVEEQLNPQDNLEEFKPLSEEDIEQLRLAATQTQRAGRAVIMSSVGTALGDIALVPGPSLKHRKASVTLPNGTCQPPAVGITFTRFFRSIRNRARKSETHASGGRRCG